MSAPGTPPPGPRGRFVTLPDGERIFMVEPEEGGPPPGVVPLSELEGLLETGPDGKPVLRPDAPLPSADGLGQARGGFRPAPGRELATLPEFRTDAEREHGRGRGERMPAGFDAPGADEIVSLVPGRIVRWGIGVICGAFAVLLALGGLIRYPETIEIPAIVTTPEPPVRVAASTGGVVRRLLVADQERVATGEVLVELASSASWNDLRLLAEALEQTPPGEPLPLDRALALGEVQPAYAAYREAVAHARTLASDPFHRLRIESLRAQVAGQARLAEAAEERVGLAEAELALATRELERVRQLRERELLSAQEAERAESEHLGRRQALQAVRAEAAAQRLRASEAAARVLDLEQQQADETARRTLEVDRTHAALEEAVRQWEVRYLLQAPADGRVSFFRAVSEGQFAPPGEPLVAVVPEGRAATAILLVPDRAAARVRVGQEVRLRLDGYPENRHGSVRGRVETVALVPEQPRPGDPSNGNRYRVGVALPAGLRTDRGETLELMHEMTATATVVLQNRTVLQRLFARLRGGEDV